ncbi:MAG: cyclic pyranopterin monophosphate synthase MoaC [Candidatus Latescibacterota bacterium]|nr:MAG: cyclic pyranopterin monophosphate synthase MoaC [Candidatus Latescibacterota bacterium]
MDRPSHLDKSGRVRMVDVGPKPESDRRAVATVRVLMSNELLKILEDNTLAKGDAIAAARIAGIQAAKRTGTMIPLCHPLPLTYVGIDCEFEHEPPSIRISAETRTCYRTGVEMEALTAAAVAALTIYDMGKSVDRAIIIDQLRLESKSGGTSGDWRRE